MIVYGRGLDRNNKQLYQACKKQIGETILARAADLSAYVGSDGSRFWHGDKELPHIDVCFVRSLGSGSFEQVTKRVSLIKHLESSGTFVINPVEAFLKTRDKYAAMFVLAEAGLPIPSTFVTEMAHWAYRKSRDFKQAVYKPLIGSLGFGSMKFDNVDLAFNTYTKLERMGKPLYVQEYIEKSRRDIRAFVLGEKVLAAISRVAQPNKWKTNIAQGAKAKAVQLPTKTKKLALKATKTLGLIYAGVDILKTHEKTIILEVNSSPSWQGLQEATGIQVAEELVSHVIDSQKCLKTKEPALC